jgi:transcription antitermination factor NusG
MRHLREPANQKAISHSLALRDKPQEDKPADGDKPAEKPDDKEQKQEGAPEKYEFKAGEGVELDTEALKDFEPVARDLNLTNEQAQKLVDAYPKILAGVQQRQAEAWQAQTESGQLT